MIHTSEADSTGQYGRYVRLRLDMWGREFRLGRDVELLGHKSKDMLQILIEHRGEMPARTIGFRPLTIPPLEMQVEDIVRGIHGDAPHLAAVLRAFYCGNGRQGFERREIAEEMLRVKLPRPVYFAYHKEGFQRVAEALTLRRAA